MEYGQSSNRVAHLEESFPRVEQEGSGVPDPLLKTYNEID